MFEAYCGVTVGTSRKLVEQMVRLALLFDLMHVHPLMCHLEFNCGPKKSASRNLGNPLKLVRAAGSCVDYFSCAQATAERDSLKLLCSVPQ